MPIQSVSIKGDDKLKLYLSNIPANVFVAAKSAMADAVAGTHSSITNNLTTGKLKTRSGALKRSMRTNVSGKTISTLTGSVYSAGVPYAKIHESGGKIRAKRAYRGIQGGPYLNIPLSPNKTPAGVMRKNAKAVFQEGGYMVKSRKGKWLVMSAAGKPMFVLAKSVTISARLGMADAAEGEVPTLIGRLRDLMGEAIQ